MKKIAIYGGTFDPIHHGHLILAREAVETLGLDGLIFVPNAISPHKLATLPTRPELRLAMVRAAIAGEPGLSVCELDLQRGGQSFAIDTVRELQAAEPGAAWIYLIGEDNIPALPTWKEFAVLDRLVEFVVFSRREQGAPHGYRRVGRQVEISATEIRRRVASGASIRYLVPEAVREIITRERLYHSPARQPFNQKPQPIKSEQLAALCAELAANKKADDIVALDLRGISGFTDFFVICSGNSEPHLKAIAGEIRDRLKVEHQVAASAVDGYPMSQWIILDYSDVVVHVFHESKRGFYSLEDLWGDAPRLNLPPPPTEG